VAPRDDNFAGIGIDYSEIDPRPNYLRGATLCAGTQETAQGDAHAGA